MNISNTDLMPYALVWAVLAAIVIALIIYRKMVARAEDDTLHVLDAETKAASSQTTMARKLEKIDRWGKSLTVLAVVYGLAVGAGFVYQSFVNASMNPLGR